MLRRFLFGPLTSEFAELNQRRPPAGENFLTFAWARPADLVLQLSDSWESLLARCPAGWQPDGVILYLPYTTIPAFLWSASVPLIGWAGDWNLLWHGYRRWLPRCDLILSDKPGAEVMCRAGMTHARAVQLFACQTAFRDAVAPGTGRDIDILFAGNLHRTVQRERLAWLGRLANLGERWHVEFHAGVYGESYRRLLQRARIVFNRGIIQEGANLRTFEAVAAGALLFQEAGNEEVSGFFGDRKECVYYTSENLEELLNYYLEHEEERQAIAAAAQARLGEHSLEVQWRDILQLLDEEWTSLSERARGRPAGDSSSILLGRCWQDLSSSHGSDPALALDLLQATSSNPSAALFNALGLAAGSAIQRKAPIPGVARDPLLHFQRALELEPDHVLARLNLAEAFVAAGQNASAIDQAHLALASLERFPDYPPDIDPDTLPGWCQEPHFPGVFDVFRVEWDRAGWAEAGQPGAEFTSKKVLLRWRLHLLLAELTESLDHYQAAAKARLDLAMSRAALGCALGRAGRPAEAIEHLRRAVADDPFDAPAARALFHAFGAVGDKDGQNSLVRHRLLLHRAAPRFVPPEPWFTKQAPPPPPPLPPSQALPGTELSGRLCLPAVREAEPRGEGVPRESLGKRTSGLRVSLTMIVKNEEGRLADCLQSVRDLVDEMIVVDTGSTDRTREVARQAGARVFDFTWVDSFAAARNESLRNAEGAWIFWLDGDERLDEENRRRFRDLLGQLRAGENVAYTMRQRSPLETGLHGIAQVDQVRLFPNHPGLTWHYRVHEQILADLRRLGAQVRGTDIVIAHGGFADPSRQGAKVERNLRLLELDVQDHPEDAFILYNLGAISLTQRRPADALKYLQKSLDHGRRGDTLEHKIYVLLVRSHQELRNGEEALKVCRGGLALYPRDPELLFVLGMLLKDQGKAAEAEACLLQVLQLPPGQQFTSIDAGLQGFRTRHFLGEMYREQGRLGEAEAQWRAAVADNAAFYPAWVGLADLFLEQGRYADLQPALARLQSAPTQKLDAAILQGRYLLAQKEFSRARRLLEEVIVQVPRAVFPQVILSHIFLQEGKDWDGAERVLREVLALDPSHPQARRNLQILLHQQGRLAKTAPVPSGPLPQRPAVAAGGAPSSDPLVSLCMIVRNEENNLPACLGSVADLVQEMVVVDTGSTDKTREVAVQFGARVVEFPWVDSFAAARNESLRHARGRWILWLDADDRLDEENRSRLRSLFCQLPDSPAAFSMKCLCLPDPVTGTLTAVDHVRLFRNLPGLTWVYRVHEQILPALRLQNAEIRWSDVVIHHTGYQDPVLRGRKLERDLRLLKLEDAERPNDPFTLFNLGCIHQEFGKLQESIAYLRRSLERSQPSASIVRKLYAMLAQCHRHLGQKDQALAACAAGRKHYPEDVELLFQEGLIRYEGSDLAGAEKCWTLLLHHKEAPHFASVDTGLSGHKARHNLAVLYKEQGRLPEAEVQLGQVLKEQPTFLPGWVELAELLLLQARWEELEQTINKVETLVKGSGPEATILRARLFMARGEFPAARYLLEQAIQRFPRELKPRIYLSHALLQEGQDVAAAEKSLRAVLAMEPGHKESLHNLKLLLEKQDRAKKQPA